MSNSGVIAFGTVNQRVGTSPSVLPLLGGSNLTNISISGNTFSYSVSEVAILNVGVFLQTIDDDKSYSIEIFDVTAGTSAQSYSAVADGQSASNYQSFVFNFGVISGHQYSVRMRGLGGGDPNNQLVVSQGTIWSTNLAGGGGGVAFSAITSGTNTTATMTVGNGAVINVAIGGAIGGSSVEPTTTVLGNGTIGGGIVAGTAGTSSVFIGQNAAATATGQRNVIIGCNAGQNITSSNNVFIGYQTGKSQGAVTGCTFVGANAGQTSGGASNCTIVGQQAGFNVNGAGNTLIGQLAGGATLSSGVNNIIIGINADTNAFATGGAIIIGSNTAVGSSSSIIIATGATSSSTTNDLIIRSGDTGINRVAAGVIQPNLGSATAGWMQTAGRVALAASYTNNTATFSNTNLSVTLIAGRTYSFSAALYVSNSTITEGVKIDFGGGAATATSFTAQAIISDGTTVDASTRLTALTTVASAATLTNSGVILVTGTIVVNTGGTFIIRAAENSTAAGTLTMTLGSYLTMWDTITA